jgi:hypothetical protein
VRANAVVGGLLLLLVAVVQVARLVGDRGGFDDGETASWRAGRALWAGWFVASAAFVVMAISSPS